MKGPPAGVGRFWRLAALAALAGSGFPACAETAPLHRQVLVFIPAYEGSALFDPDLAEPGAEPTCVWGTLNAFRTSDLYFGLRMPNALEARPMLSAGPVSVYETFYRTITRPCAELPDFRPYTDGADFFIFAYDWRQEIATVSAPALARALEGYAARHEQLTGLPAAQTHFILVAHSMGGLVARTLLSIAPEWCGRVDGLYLVGCPNLGSVKAIRTLVVGPGGLKENALSFPASLLNFLPNTVSAGVTKLVAITRPSLYELLPFTEPRWESVATDGTRRRIGAREVLTVETWRPYWPSAELERKLFLDDWLARQIAAGRKKIDPAAWAFCQDAGLGPLQKLLIQTRDWRLRLGSLSYTSTLLTRPNEPSRLHLVVGTGLKTPTGVITEGEHDACSARLTYAPDTDGDETVTGASVLDDLTPTASNLKLLPGVTHGKLMNDPEFLRYFCRDLAATPTLPGLAASLKSAGTSD